MAKASSVEDSAMQLFRQSFTVSDRVQRTPEGHMEHFHLRLGITIVALPWVMHWAPIWYQPRRWHMLKSSEVMT